jgi:hypothetical protein|uniref:Uncharacterized protein n=1 Tax=Siphoviridae sp. ctqwY3 TaxID=2827951 RepID=A0A8S5S6T8_9CAUD|nr:MAG TPA: hypothetical protein [Siphoviridae sp. ctqwY3]
MNWFVNNREVIKGLSINTGTSTTPTFTAMCTTSEVGLTTDLEEKDFYVFCDAIKRSLITGAKLSIDCTVKIDMNNQAIVQTLGNIHDLIENGTVAQFNNILVQFELLESVQDNVLTYKKYQVPVVMKFSDLGGNAEDEGEYSLELVINGKGTVVTGA